MLPDPEFPPLLSGHAVPAEEDPFQVATQAARKGDLGAGDLCWSMAESHARAAVVLEPDCCLATAVEVVPLMMVAIGDALGAIGPPNLAFMYRWPSVLLANGGEVGEVMLHVPEQLALSDRPDFMVLGFSIAMSLPAEMMPEPGLARHATALFEEGCGDLDRTQIIEAVARHFLSWIDAWQHDGFGAAHADYLGRMQPADTLVIDTGAVTHKGRMVGIDENGGLLLEGDGGVYGLSIAEVLGIAG